MLNLQAYLKRLEEACDFYDQSAPTVRDHCDDLYVRIGEAPERVTLAELTAVQALWSDVGWMHPNYAANLVYKTRHRLGMNTAGHAGF